MYPIIPKKPFSPIFFPGKISFGLNKIKKSKKEKIPCLRIKISSAEGVKMVLKAAQLAGSRLRTGPREDELQKAAAPVSGVYPRSSSPLNAEHARHEMSPFSCYLGSYYLISKDGAEIDTPEVAPPAARKVVLREPARPAPKQRGLRVRKTLFSGPSDETENVIENAHNNEPPSEGAQEEKFEVLPTLNVVTRGSADTYSPAGELFFCGLILGSLFVLFVALEVYFYLHRL